MPTTDARGRHVLEMAARLGLTVANVGNKATFRRPGNTGTIPDITLVTESLARFIGNWRVIEDFTGSDHQYITFNLQRNQSRPTGNGVKLTGWNVSKLDEDILELAINRGKDAVLSESGSPEDIVNTTMCLVRQACDDSMPRRAKLRRRKTAVYWWTEEIAELRRKCLRLRRIVTRARRRNRDVEMEHSQFSQARRALKNAIFRSKQLKWEDLKRDVDNDPWGLGYKIVMRKLGSQSPTPKMDAREMGKIVSTLFPTHPLRSREQYSPPSEDVPLFTEEELNQAAGSLQNKKAPGPDGIPSEEHVQPLS
ncbi:uncharacterized protein [Rhodnius prolixus]|uniref:uncharacterized protein n=1 Tax=Rhodnius prolixus TaxID=13249 RepID=UPI003D188773